MSKHKNKGHNTNNSDFKHLSKDDIKAEIHKLAAHEHMSKNYSSEHNSKDVDENLPATEQNQAVNSSSISQKQEYNNDQSSSDGRYDLPENHDKQSDFDEYESDSDQESRVLAQNSEHEIMEIEDENNLIVTKNTSPYSNQSHALVVADKKPHPITEINKPQSLSKGTKVNTGLYYTKDHTQPPLSNTSPTRDYKSLAERTRIGTASGVQTLKDLKKRFNFNWRKLAQRAGVAGFIFGILLLLGASFIIPWALNKYNNSPSILDLIEKPPESTKIFASDGETLLFEVYKQDERRENIEVCDTQKIENNQNCIPDHVQDAIVALEDENFYKTDDTGIAWSNYAGAIWKCGITFGDTCRGASGLSQQIVKIATGKQNERTLEEKINELFTAIKFNEEMPDRSQRVETYLNLVPFGRRSYGIQAASQAFFGKDVKDLDIVEACYLASMPQNPSTYPSAVNNLPDTESFNWQRLEGRKNICLTKLQELNLRDDGFPKTIPTVEEKEALIAKEAVLAPTEEEVFALREQGFVVFVPDVNDEIAPHFRDFVRKELENILGEQELFSDGYKVVTTIDLEMQSGVEQIIAQNRESLIERVGSNNAATVIIDQETGEIKAMVGSLDYNNLEIEGKNNLATAPTQPGSSTKPIVYANFWDNGFNPGTVLIDISTDFGGGYTPNNADLRFRGPISGRNSLPQSLNIPAVKALCLSIDSRSPDCRGGALDYMNFARNVGVDFPCIPVSDDPDNEGLCNDPVSARKAVESRCAGASIALGGCESTLLSVVTGINTIKNEGDLRTAVPIISIKDRDGVEVFTEKVRQEYYPRKDEVIDDLLAKQVTNVISDYNARRPVFGRLSQNLELSACRTTGKTGTTNSVTATWAVGGCSNFTVGVLLRNTDNSPISGARDSATSVAPLFKQINEYTLNFGDELEEFDFSGLVGVRLNPATGYPISEGGYIELLTPDQLTRLQAGVSFVSNPENNYRQGNIFDYRSAVISVEQNINKIDGLLATDKTLEENIEKKTCTLIIGEFPQTTNWINPIAAYLQNLNTEETNICGVTQESPQDQVSEKNNTPIIQTNLQSGSKVKNITFTASVSGLQDKTIVLMELYIDNQLITSEIDKSSLSFDVTEYASSGPFSVRLFARDSFGAEIARTYNNITFDLKGSQDPDDDDNSNTEKDLGLSDISTLGMTCKSVTVGQTGECSFELPSERTLPDLFSVRVSGAANTSSCSEVGKNVVCSGISVPSVPGEYSVVIVLGSSQVNSGAKIEVLE